MITIILWKKALILSPFILLQAPWVIGRLLYLPRQVYVCTWVEVAARAWVGESHSNVNIISPLIGQSSKFQPPSNHVWGGGLAAISLQKPGEEGRQNGCPPDNCTCAVRGRRGIVIHTEKGSAQKQGKSSYAIEHVQLGQSYVTRDPGDQAAR